MKKYYALVIVLCSLSFHLLTAAPCGVGQARVTVIIVPDGYPAETTWSLYDDVTHTLLDSSTGANSDSVCVTASHCLKFTIYDAYGDGICCGYGQGSYVVQLNGAYVFGGGQFTHSESTFFNCPPGHDCSNPLTAVPDTMIAPVAETWYVFTPDSTGLYSINTCGLGNTCDPKIYMYDHCNGLYIDENNAGTTFYDDDGCGVAFQSKISASLLAGSTWYIRIGDYDTSCHHSVIKWQIVFEGPIHGCMDTGSCNYNPLATISDGSCVYPPSSLCPAPDLAVDANELEASLYTDVLTVGQTNCYISEGCLSGYGVRRLIRFDTHIRNIGNLDYYIGSPDTIGNQFVYDGCHGHWHYKGYAEYLVYDMNNQPLSQGFKNGFCVLDLECSGGGQAKYGCGNMGISVGCGDIYNAGLDCQWIDVTDIDTGNYTLVVRVNWDQSPDKLGNYERSYNNNWAQVCFHLYYDNGGNKVFNVLPNCVPYVDCAGDTFGSAIHDCNGICNGSGIRGDVNINYLANDTDVVLYLEGIKDENIPYTTCNDLNGDSAITVTDAARLNGCLRFTTNTHHHPGNTQTTHNHCDFPFNIFNPFDSITFSIADTNLEHHYVDLSVFNPSCQLLAYEFKMHGLVVDSVKNLAVGNYAPDIRSSSTGHIVGISEDENALFKQLAPLNFLRVYFSSLNDTVICITDIVAVVNADYEEVKGKVGNGCVHIAQPVIDTTTTSIGSIEAAQLDVIPNPSTGVFEVYMQGKSMSGADMKVTDALGRVVYHNRNTGLTNHATIDLREEQSGIYMLQVNVNGVTSVKRLLLSK